MNEVIVEGYAVAWAIYLVSAAALCVIASWVFRRLLQRDLAYLALCLLIAILFTPWYVLPDADVMAPAFMVLLMDSITQGAAAAVRALIPLVMSLAAALLLTPVISIAARVIQRRRARRSS